MENIYHKMLGVFNILADDNRVSVIGLLMSMIIAIVIFIAEYIRDKNTTEIRKKFFINKTNLKKMLGISFVLVFLLLLEPLFNASKSSKYFIFLRPYDRVFNIAFILYQIAILYTSIKMIIGIMISFYEAIKLVANKKYFEEQFYLFLDDIINKNLVSNNSNDSEAKKQMNDFINENKGKIALQSNNSNLDKYVPIVAQYSGTVKSFNYEKIEKLLLKIEKDSAYNTVIYYNNNEPILIIKDILNKKINNGYIIGYCLEPYIDYFEDSKLIINYYPTSRIDLNLFKNINIDLLLTYRNEYSDLDGRFNFSRYNYYSKLFKSNNEAVLNQLSQDLDNIAYSIRNDFEKKDRFLSFISSLSILAIEENQISFFYENGNRITELFCYGIERTNEKQIAYLYCLYYFKNAYYEITDEKFNYDYYQTLMSNLLSIIITFLKYEKYDGIDYLLRNITIPNKFYQSRNNEKNVADIQFSYGILKAIYLKNSKKTNKEDVPIINELLKWTFYNFTNIYSAQELIDAYKNNWKNNSLITKIYSHVDFDDKKYLSSWSIVSPNISNIITFALEKFHKHLNTIYDENRVDTNDSNVYSKILEELKEKENPELLQKYELLLTNIIAACHKQEVKNNINLCVVDNILETIKEKIRNNIKPHYIKDEIINIKSTNEINNELYGFDMLVEKGLLNSKSEYVKFMIKNFVDDFIYHQDKLLYDVIKKTKNVSLIKWNKRSKYVLIGNNISINQFKSSDYGKEKIENYKIEYIYLSIKCDLILMKKNNLPELELYKYNGSFEVNNIIDNYYCNITDLNKDSDMREKIILSNSWLNKKNNLEDPNEYLKQRCRVQLLMNLNYKVSKEASYQKINISELK